jgi:glucose/arabinose dehydrogenase
VAALGCVGLVLNGCTSANNSNIAAQSAAPGNASTNGASPRSMAATTTKPSTRLARAVIGAGAGTLHHGIRYSEEVPDGVDAINGLILPRGFTINVFAAEVHAPRRLAIAPGGTPGSYDVFVAESNHNRISILRDSNGDGKVDARFTFTDNVSQPYGLAFWPATAPGGGWLYVGNTGSVVRFPYRNGETKATGNPQHITDLTRGGYNQHWTRNLLFSPDYSRLFVTVGSSCNVCEEDDSQRAAISVMKPDGSQRRVFASGLRNPVGMDWRPGTQELWTVVNERDYRGPDQPPDFLTLVRDGAFYGWPYVMTDIDGHMLPDKQFEREGWAKLSQTTPPTVPVQAHSAALGLAFYPPASKFKSGAAGLHPFPAEYFGDAFLAYHGSWNRPQRTGYKIVRVHFNNSRPVSVTDFVAGFLQNEAVSGRPVDVQVAPDGSLLFSDDAGGRIYRVSYTGNKTTTIH